MKETAGIATLEASICFVLLCSILLGGAAITDYLSQLRLLHSTAESSLGDSNVKPFLVRTESGGPQADLVLNRSELDHYLHTAVTNSIEEIGAREYLIEAKYVTADIDPYSGQFLGFDLHGSTVISSGNLSVGVHDLAFCDLDTRFDELASATHAHPPGVSIVAVPTGINVNESTDPAYFKRSLLVGMKIFASLEGSLTGNALVLIGRQPIVYGYKVVQLRGTVQ